MDVAINQPIIYISTAGLWKTVSLIVFGVVPPASGQAAPTHEYLATITVNTQQPIVLPLPLLGNKFKHVAIAYGITTGPTEVGTVTVSIMRDQDPLEPGGTRPVHKVVELTRSAVSSPTYIVRTFALVGTA
jgi:hypothetical protein